MNEKKARRRSVADSHVVFVGLMGTGKSTVGSLLAVRLHRPFFDNDVLLELRSGRTAASLRRESGNEALHRLEADLLLDCLASRPFAVIAAAASTVLSADVRDALRDGAFVVWLRTDVRVLTARLVDPGTRPLSGDVGEVLAEQAHEREGLYASIADIVVDTGERAAVEVVEELLERVVELRR